MKTPGLGQQTTSALHAKQQHNTIGSKSEFGGLMGFLQQSAMKLLAGATPKTLSVTEPTHRFVQNNSDKESAKEGAEKKILPSELLKQSGHDLLRLSFPTAEYQSMMLSPENLSRNPSVILTEDTSDNLFTGVSDGDDTDDVQGIVQIKSKSEAGPLLQSREEISDTQAVEQTLLLPPAFFPLSDSPSDVQLPDESIREISHAITAILNQTDGAASIEVSVKGASLIAMDILPQHNKPHHFAVVMRQNNLAKPVQLVNRIANVLGASVSPISELPAKAKTLVRGNTYVASERRGNASTVQKYALPNMIQGPSSPRSIKNNYATGEIRSGNSSLSVSNYMADEESPKLILQNRIGQSSPKEKSILKNDLVANLTAENNGNSREKLSGIAKAQIDNGLKADQTASQNNRQPRSLNEKYIARANHAVVPEQPEPDAPGKVGTVSSGVWNEAVRERPFNTQQNVAAPVVRSGSETPFSIDDTVFSNKAPITETEGVVKPSNKQNGLEPIFSDNAIRHAPRRQTATQNPRNVAVSDLLEKQDVSAKTPPPPLETAGIVSSLSEAIDIRVFYKQNKRSYSSNAHTIQPKKEPEIIPLGSDFDKVEIEKNQPLRVSSDGAFSAVLPKAKRVKQLTNGHKTKDGIPLGGIKKATHLNEPFANISTQNSLPEASLNPEVDPGPKKKVMAAENSIDVSTDLSGATKEGRVTSPEKSLPGSGPGALPAKVRYDFMRAIKQVIHRYQQEQNQEQLQSSFRVQTQALGNLDIHILEDEAGFQIQIFADQEAARSRLEKELPALEKSLDELNISLGSIAVDVGGQTNNFREPPPRKRESGNNNFADSGASPAEEATIKNQRFVGTNTIEIYV
ncbi:MAG: flagellar hook-length control protein FliK [Calditrichia bacterium]